MAESYRGLTIRIGGDTTKLTQALHTANQAITGTQSSMKKLSDALKMDPTSLKASQLQVGEFASQAANAATRLVTLNEAMRQVGDEIKTFNGSAATVREMANSWGNVNMVASQTRDYYEALTKTLATTYTEFSKTYTEASKMASLKMAEGITLDYGSFEKTSQKIKEVATAFNANDKQVEQFTSRLQKVSERYDELCDKQEQYQAIVDNGDIGSKEFEKAANQLAKVNAQLDQTRTRFASVMESFKGFKSDELFKYDADNTDLASLAKSLYQMVEVGAMTAEQADKMYDSFERMKNEWESAFENVKTANVVEGFHDMEAETEKATAKVKSLVDEMVRLSDTSEVAKGFVALEQEFGVINDKGAVAEQRLKAILEIMSKSGNENNTFLQREAMRDYAEATAEAQAAVDNINKRLDQYSGTIRKLAADTKSYADETSAANKQYEESAAALKGYEGAMNEIKTLRDNIKKNNPGSFEDDKDYQALSQTLAAMEEVLNQLKTRFKDAAAEKEKFVQIGEVRELTDELANGLDKVKSYENINIKPEVDLSAVDGLKKALEAISNSTFNADGLSKFRDGVKQATDALSDAEKRYKTLSEAAKQDPTNSETLRMRTIAFDEVVQATVAHIDAMKAELAAIPSDRVNQAALAAGKADEAYSEAKKEVDRWKDSLIDVNKRIDELTKERDSIKVVTPEDKQRVDELNKSLDELKQRRAAIAATGDAAFDNLAVAENTRLVQEHSVAIQQDEARLHELGEEARNVGNANATPKIDEAAFMQVVDRIAQAARQMASEVVQASNEIDSAYRDMRKTVNGTEEDFAKLREAAIEYSKDSFTSADQMLEMQALGGQLGVAVENLEQFGQIASNLDIATDIDAETVALKLGQISNVLGLDIDGMQGFSDALVRLGNNMPAQESAIMAVAQRFGAVAATASFSGDEVLAWSAAIAATGQHSEAAATAISNTVSGIEQAVANGGADLKQFAAIASMSADEFVNSWKSSPTETLRAFINGLKTLKDSDESAVAALENMGITGVRQQQTLLALTQTIGNLDEALLMSRDAWNGISDQWGQAGDAAIEAGRKSEGFSGALQIMKNNAQNLAASLGDGLVPFMKAAADVMGILTDALNAMPQPVKELVVMLGATSIAFSTLTPMLKVFSKGMADIVLTAAKTSTISEFIAELTGFSKVGAAFDTATIGATGFAEALTGPTALGIAAVVVAIGAAISAISDYSEKQAQFQQATTGLTTATQEAKTAYDNYVVGAQESARSLGELKTAMEEATEAQANLATKMGEAWSGIGASEATVDMMVSKIAELTSKESLTLDEQNELNAAVQTFNNLTGNAVQVLDGQSGAIDTTASALEDMAQGWKNATEEAQHLEDYADAAQQLAEKQALLAEVQASLGDSTREQGEWFVDMRDSANSTTGAVSSLASQAQQLEQEIAALESKMNESVSGMGDLGQEVARVENAFQATGDSLSNYGTFTDSELRAIVEAFNSAGDGSISALERVRRAIDGLRSGANDAASITTELESASKEAASARAEAYKTQATAEYNNTKAGLDAAYKAAQRGYDAQYKAQQKAFDAQYKAQQKAFEKQYNGLKKKLDEQYNARKKAYDKQLAALKKNQDAEVDAFKKATDAKLKEMEREYKARVKMLEQEYGSQTDDIDERIAALKGETEAEKKAIEERDEEEKKAELQKAVTAAKSRRTRQEAEKALNDYLQELESKRNEDSRNAEIERLQNQKDTLKTELADRKAILKEQYDEEVAAYKASREEQLEAIKAENTAQYEAEKERLDKLLEKLKENNTARLEAMKESQTAQLEAMKESQSAQLEAMKASQSAALESMKASHTQQLQQLKAAQDAKYKEIKAGNDAESKAEQEKMSQLQQTQASGNEKISAAEARHLASMEERMKRSGDNKIRAASEANDAINRDTDSKLAELTRTYRDRGDEATRNLAEAFRNGEELVGRNAKSISNAAIAPFGGLSGDMYTSGWDMLVQFNNGLVDAWNRGSGLKESIENVAQYITDRLGFSVPKYGPMAGADKWGPDMVYLIAGGIKDKQSVLIRQVEKMSDAMEEAFDPTLSVDAAYEALDTIGKKRSASLGAIVETNGAPTVNVTLNMNLSDVSIRSDADIERLARVMSQEMATQAARQLAGRLG